MSEFLMHYFATAESLARYSDHHSVGTRERKSKALSKSGSGLANPSPPLPEQRKIAAILSSVDDAIEKTQAVIDQVQVVKKGLMQELLTRGIPGRHTRFKKTEIGEIPEEWRRSLAQRCCSDKTRSLSVDLSGTHKWFSVDGPGWVRIVDVTRSDRSCSKQLSSGCQSSVSRKASRFTRAI